ncbi:permease prefix domain 1-containing protein [Niallia sp. Sow4_A1]|uniref:permease prefix domain 1-containing protein n=1 Tax=Niallia sp. Sow4_A1 TaxID=3438793 RepID=UPI003F9DC23C
MKRDAFLNEVMKQIKSKKAKRDVRTELEYHLNNSKSKWMEKGISEVEAEEKAVEQMGNPIILGTELNKLHTPNYIYFIKLNVISLLYALLITFPIEIMFNVYRISRLTGLNLGTVNTFVIITTVGVLLLGTVLLYTLTKRWLKYRKSNFWTIILWFPYFILLFCLVAAFFPISNEMDNPGYGAGILAIGGILYFPIYILILNIVGYSINNKLNINK